MEDDELVAAPDEAAGVPTAAQAAAVPSGTSLGKRKPGRPALHHGCQVCGADLDHLKLFHQRYHICIDCMALEKVLVKGVDSRFCQQCGRFHELDAFGPGMRSCRKQLAKHAERRRRARELAARAAGKDTRRRSVYAQRLTDTAAASKSAAEAFDGDVAEAQAEAKRSRGQEEGMGEAPQPIPSLDQLLSHPRLPPLPWPLPDAGSGSAGSTAHLVNTSGDASALAALVAAAEEEREGGEAARDQQQAMPAAASAALPPLQPPQAGALGREHAGGAATASWAAGLPPPASAGSLFGGGLQLAAPGPAPPLLVRSHTAGPQHSAHVAYTPQQMPSPQQQQSQLLPSGEQKLLDFFSVLSALGGAPAAAQAQQGAALQQAAWQQPCGMSALEAAQALSQAAVEHTQRRAEQQQQEQLLAALAALAPPAPVAAPPTTTPLQQLLQQLGQHLGQPSAPVGRPNPEPAPPAPTLPQPPAAALPTPPAATQQDQGGLDPSTALFQSAVGGLLLSILNPQQR